MGDILNYREEITKAMKLLSLNNKVVFIGQNVVYPGAIDINGTLDGIPLNRRIEFPVIEDAQMGISIGLSLVGFIPVSVYPRMDFLIIAMNELVNHLDKIEQISHGEFCPKVIIRTCVGLREPLDPGPQHYQDHTETLRSCLTNVDVVKLEEAKDIVPSYEKALRSKKSTILVELAIKMRG